MSAYARGKRALGICDKTGFRYKLSDLVPEYRNGKPTGMRVGKDVVDPDHPQNFLGRLRINDPQALQDPRPDSSLGAARGLFGWRPVGHPEVRLVGAVGTVNIVTGD